MRDAIAAAGLGRRIDLVGPNGKIIYLLTGFLFLMGFGMAFLGNGGLVGWIGGACGFGMGLYIFSQKSKNRVVIYENGIVVSGIMVQQGTFKYSDMVSSEWRGGVYNLLGIIPVFEYMNLTIYGKGGALVTLSSLFYADLEEKFADLDEKIAK